MWVEAQVSLPRFAEVAQWAGYLSLACFSGTFLGGLLLSFTWTAFGPWNQLRLTQQALDDAKKECEACRLMRELDNETRLREKAEMADIKTRYLIIAQALEASGMRLQLGAMKIDPLPEALKPKPRPKETTDY